MKEGKENWEYKTLGEVCTIERGGSPRPIKNFITEEANGLNWIKIGDTDKGGKYIYETKEKIRPEGLKNSRWVECDDFLLSNSMSFGRPYIMKTTGCIHDGWLVLRNYKNYLKIDFFYYLLSSPFVQRQFSEKAQGSTVSNLNTQRVSNVHVRIPPISEQQNIVRYLDESFAKIDALKANAEKSLADAKALFQAELKKAMEPKEGWEEKMLKDIAIYRRGSFPQPYGNKDWYDGKNSMPFVQVAELQEDSFKLVENTKKRISKKAQPLSVYVPKGTVLVSLQGSIGKVAISQYDSYVDRTVAIFQSYKMEIDKYFFSCQLKLRFEIEREKARGTTIKTITKEEFANFNINVPPLTIQQSIVTHLDTLSAKVTQLQQNLERIKTECDALKQALLRQVFE